MLFRRTPYFYLRILHFLAHEVIRLILPAQALVIISLEHPLDSAQIYRVNASEYID